MPIMQAMRTDAAISHFRTQTALAKALGMSQSSIATWGEFPPKLRQLQLERLTQGALLAEPGILPDVQENGASAQAA